MTTIHILYGTESGNAEMVADDVAAVLQERGFDTEIAELCDVGIESLADMTLAVFITSTYGEGSLPETAAPFYDRLVAQRPDLTGLSFGAFGLGDSAYESFNNGIETLRAMLIDLGARQLGETAKHDAGGAETASDLAFSWASVVTDLIPV
ncbi:flavodoxin domain-containing protein [Mycolicibacterium setense]